MNNIELIKKEEFYRILVQWVNIHHKGRNLNQYFHENNFKSVAIYGMAELGELLYDELYDSDIEIKYVIDKNHEKVYAEVPVLSPENELHAVDVIVVTSVYYYDEVRDFLANKVSCPVISLNTVVFSLNY